MISAGLSGCGEPGSTTESATTTGASAATLGTGTTEGGSSTVATDATRPTTDATMGTTTDATESGAATTDATGETTAETATDGGNPYDGRPPLGLVVNTCPALDGIEGEVIESLAQDGADFYAQRVEFRQLTDDPDFVALIQFALPWYKSLGYRVLLTIPTVDTALRTMPDDVVDLPLDSPETIARFEQALEELLTPEVIAAIDWISIGNEVDLYFGAHPEDVAPFVTFADAGYAKLASLGLNAPHCVTFTQEGVEFDVAGAATALLPSCTFLPMTLYPMSEEPFHFLPPLEGAAKIADFPEIPDLPRVYQEIGYVSAASNGGSPELQAEFFHEAFTHTLSSDIQAVAVNWYCDHPIELCKDFVEHLYGVPPGSPDYDAFVGFICSLGLVESEGEPKPAFAVFEEAIAAMPL